MRSHLYDSSHRETFESAHSVMLSIFAANADKPHSPLVVNQGETQDELVGLARRLVPGYVKCLLDVRISQHQINCGM